MSSPAMDDRSSAASSFLPGSAASDSKMFAAGSFRTGYRRLLSTLQTLITEQLLFFFTFVTAGVLRPRALKPVHRKQVRLGHQSIVRHLSRSLRIPNSRSGSMALFPPHPRWRRAGASYLSFSAAGRRVESTWLTSIVFGGFRARRNAQS
jgi:hypothetical protein